MAAVAIKVRVLVVYGSCWHKGKSASYGSCWHKGKSAGYGSCWHKGKSAGYGSCWHKGKSTSFKVMGSLVTSLSHAVLLLGGILGFTISKLELGTLIPASTTTPPLPPPPPHTRIPSSTHSNTDTQSKIKFTTVIFITLCKWDQSVFLMLPSLSSYISIDWNMKSVKYVNDFFFF